MSFKERFIRYCFRHPAAIDAAKTVFSYGPLVNSRLYKQWVTAIARRYAKKSPCGIMDVDIETTLDCNSKCIMCYHGVKTLSGTMDMALFKKIIDDCLDNNITGVGLSVYGEPLCDKYFFDRIEYLKKKDMTYSFFTNGSLLDEEKAKGLLSAGGLKRINFSVCGYEKDVYEKVMAGLNRDSVYKNILYFLGLKEKLGRKDTAVAVLTVKTALNKNDMKKFIKFWQGRRGVDYIITADLWDRLGENRIERIGHIGKMHKRRNWCAPCRQLWGRVYVYYDGRVAPCCDDNDIRNLIIGDMNNETLREIYAGEELRRLRQTHLEDKRRYHGACGRCYHNSVWFN